jgi:hypothetical protein
MLAFDLNLSLLLSQREDTIIPMYEIMQTQLSCYCHLQYKNFKEPLAMYYSVLKRSLWHSYGQHDIEWDLFMALHVTMMNVEHKTDIEADD